MQGKSLIDDFKDGVLKSNNTLLHLIVINAAIFLLMNLIYIGFRLSGYHQQVEHEIMRWVAVPASLENILTVPWTIITYMFAHSLTDWLHILFNMLILYWFGKIFQEYLGNKKLLSTYIMGGLMGVVFFIVAFNLFPLFHDMVSRSILVGASASVLAIVIATATLLPDYSLRLLLIGNVKLKYIALFLIVLDVLRTVGTNAGGSFAHLGGAFYGFMYIKQLQKGNDLGGWLTNFFNWIGDKFSSKSNLKVHKSQATENPARVGYTSQDAYMRQYERNKKMNVSQEEVDRILDKIASSGYESLTKREKEILFKASND